MIVHSNDRGVTDDSNRSVMNKYGLLLVIVLSLSFYPLRLSSASRTNDDCREQRNFNGEEFWFWEAHTGVENIQDRDNYRFGRLVNDPGICFRVPLASIAEPIARTVGYKRATAELHGMVYVKQADWNQPALHVLRAKITKLTGQDFSSFSQFQTWWFENNDYLIWSEAEGHLIVDEAAKRTKNPIAPLHPIQEINAERYWFFEGMGWLRQTGEDSEYIEGTAWTGDKEQKVRIQKVYLTDRAAKQRGYLEAVKTIIQDRLSLKELGITGERELINRLQVITGKKLEDRQSWIQWWTVNRSSLVLSQDGQRLIQQSQ